MKSKDWLNRQKRDFYVKKAKKQGYLSRAAYKLIEIENKFNILSKFKKNIRIWSCSRRLESSCFRNKSKNRNYCNRYFRS